MRAAARCEPNRVESSALRHLDDVASDVGSVAAELLAANVAEYIAEYDGVRDRELGDIQGTQELLKEERERERKKKR